MAEEIREERFKGAIIKDAPMNIEKFKEESEKKNQSKDGWHSVECPTCNGTGKQEKGEQLRRELQEFADEKKGIGGPPGDDKIAFLAKHLLDKYFGNVNCQEKEEE